MTDVRLDAWSEQDMAVLEACNTSAMTRFLGGPEMPEALLVRHQRYLTTAFDGRMFAVVLPTGERVGAIGYWGTDHDGAEVWEAGWSVVPAAQGRGVAVAALTALVAAVSDLESARDLHAFPRTDNAASNALCSRVGFALLGEVDFEYPKGHPIRCNDWCRRTRGRAVDPGRRGAP